MTKELTLKDSISATLKVVAILAIVILLSIAMTSCGPSKSGQMVSNTVMVKEKIVIVDVKPGSRTTDDKYTYKVYRPEMGTVQYLKLEGLFERGDTVMYNFVKIKPIEIDFIIDGKEGDHTLIGRTKDNNIIILLVENAHSQAYELGQLISIRIE